MIKDVTRYISHQVERELWARAAGRCQFNGCNRPLFKSDVTQERVNVGEKAHIYSFAARGPRGRGPLVGNARKLVNRIENLLLVCRSCHKTIDQDKEGTRYPANLLKQWKTSHERRVAVVTGISADKKSHVVLYGANIGAQGSPLQPSEAAEALFPDWYPVDEHPIQLSMHWEGKDTDGSFWNTESANLDSLFEQRIKPLLVEGASSHFSLFAFAPMPLLVKLGALFTDKTPVEVYQLHREPRTWRWLKEHPTPSFQINQPEVRSYRPALAISLSDRITRDRITQEFPDRVSLWELTTNNPNNDLMRSREQLSDFRSAMRSILAEIRRAHGAQTPLSIFPAMPLACAIELGRVRVPKVDPHWELYDYNNASGKFIKSLTLGPVNGKPAP